MTTFKAENLTMALLIAESSYTKMMSERKEYKELNKIFLLKTIFPPYWQSSSNYDLKMKLLGEAIKNNKSLMEFSEITAFEEGVKY